MHCTTIFPKPSRPAPLRARLVAKLSVITYLGLVLASLAGCGLRDLDFNVPEEGLFDGLNRPDLANVPQRLALGATAPVRVINADQATVSSDDPNVVEVERLNDSDVLLTAVGVGSTTIYLKAEDETKQYSARVGEVDRSEVLLIETTSFPAGSVEIVAAHERSVLSGVNQQLVVANYDSEGELLYGEGLASFEILEGAEPCEVDVVGPFDAACVILQPGPNVLQVGTPGDGRNVEMTGVTQDEIVDLLVIKTDEAPEGGDLVGMVAFGVTEEGTRVYGIHAQYETPDHLVLEIFAYDFDSAATPARARVSASGFDREFVYHGELSFPSHPKLLWAVCGGWLAGPC